MNKWRHFYIDIYGVNLYFIKCTRGKFVKKTLEEFNKVVSSETSRTGGFCEVCGCSGVIWIEEWEVLHHEVFHATCWIMRTAGISLTGETEDAYAYLADYIVRLIKKRK